MIWGVDLGTRSASIVGLGETLHTASVTCAKNWDRYQELSWIARSVRSQVVLGDTVFVEEPPLAGSRNVRTALQLAQVLGAILSGVGIEAYPVPVSSWKKGTVGSGNATKEDVSDWLSEQHPGYSASCGDDQNLIDATCIALYGQQLLYRARVLGDPDSPLAAR